MTWKGDDYHTASDTHAINWAWMGDCWCVLLWSKAERKYTKRRFCTTERDRERAIEAFKAVADDGPSREAGVSAQSGGHP